MTMRIDRIQTIAREVVITENSGNSAWVASC